MNDSNPPTSPARSPQPARNKGKLTGPKPPLRPGHVWSIRAKLQLERRTRDLALFNLAIDSKLRGCALQPPRWRDAGAPPEEPSQSSAYPSRAVLQDYPRNLLSTGRRIAGGRVPRTAVSIRNMVR